MTKIPPTPSNRQFDPSRCWACQDRNRFHPHELWDDWLAGNTHILCQPHQREAGIRRLAPLKETLPSRTRFGKGADTLAFHLRTHRRMSPQRTIQELQDRGFSTDATPLARIVNNGGRAVKKNGYCPHCT